MLDETIEAVLHKKLRDFSIQHPAILAVYKGRGYEKNPGKRPVYYFIAGRNYEYENAIESGITELDLNLHIIKGLLFETEGVDLMTFRCSLEDAEQLAFMEKCVYKRK